MKSLVEVEELVFPRHVYWQIVAHARRKLSGRYLPGEEPAPVAYGAVGGRLVNGSGEVTRAVPLAAERPLGSLLDDVTVRPRTGPGTPPRRRQDAVLFGGYQAGSATSRHAGPGRRRSHVESDVAAGSGLWMFVLSMVEAEIPVLNAHFEGDRTRQAPVRLSHYLDQYL